jgi:hypothetical protein
MIASRRARRGYALVEIVLAIGTVAIVLGLCAGLLHVLLKLDRTGRSHVAETATIGRLARQFRQDVHAAATAKPGPRGENLELRLPDDHTIVYETHERALTRVDQEGATPRRRETYSLPSCPASGFEVSERDGKVWVRARLRRGLHDLAIEAVAGRDRDRDRARREAKPDESEVRP